MVIKGQEDSVLMITFIMARNEELNFRKGMAVVWKMDKMS